jgi:hypothetical protein
MQTVSGDVCFSEGLVINSDGFFVGRSEQFAALALAIACRRFSGIASLLRQAA